MHSDTDTVRHQVWDSLKDKAYRDFFVSSQLSANVAAQIYSLRESHGWTQKDLAVKTGMAQTRISVLENPEYDNFKIETLKRIAAAFDVALIVRFVPYRELVDWMTKPHLDNMIPIEYTKDKLQPTTTQYATATIVSVPVSAASSFTWSYSSAAYDNHNALPAPYTTMTFN